MKPTPRKPTLLQAVIPIVILLTLIILNVLGGSDTLAGANQLSLLLAAFIAGVIAMYNGVTWESISKAITYTLSTAIPALLILLMVGILSGSWMISGVVPTMIYYGLDILRAEYFLPATVIITAAISVATGSSWSTIATIGVALIGIGNTLGFDPAWSAGAIISGAYFGDKVSPLSDTTNLAASVAEIDLFEHIKFMMRTTVPSIIVTIIAFLIMGLLGGSGTATIESVELFKGAISNAYNVNLALLLIPAIVVYLIVKKVPATPVLMIGSLLGIGVAAFAQPDMIASLNGGEAPTARELYSILTNSMYGATELNTGVAAVDDLLSTGGMAGMINTVWLIISAMIFGGVMEAAQLLERITETILSFVKSRRSMVSATTGSCLLANLTTSDQYISIVIPGKMFDSAYERQGYDKALLSRTLEDSATATSVLIPWNTCGATQATILGVATVAYLPFAIFCWLSPLMTLLFAWLNIAQSRKV